MPWWRSSASNVGSRPRKALNDSMAGRLPPASRMASRYFRPVSHVGQAVFARGFLERRVGVRAQHLGPFVAVVAGRVTAGEDVAEGVRGAADQAGGSSTATSCAHLARSSGMMSWRRVVVGVQQHVEQRELDLAQGLHAALEVLGRQHLVEQCARQRRRRCRHAPSCACSTSHSQQKFSMNWLGSSTASHSTPLMPETSRSLTCVSMWCRPWPNSWNRVVTSSWVSSAGLPSTPWRSCRPGAPPASAAGRVGAQPARARVVHPGAAALAGARVRVEVELADQFGCMPRRCARLDAEEAHHSDARPGPRRPDAHFEQASRRS